MSIEDEIQAVLRLRAQQEQADNLAFNIIVDPTKSEKENNAQILYALTMSVGKDFESFLLVSTMSYIREMETRYEQIYKAPLTREVRDCIAIAFREGQIAGMVSILFKSFKGQVIFNKVTKEGESEN